MRIAVKTVTTRQLVHMDFDTRVVHDGDVVFLYGKTPQRGGWLVEFMYDDESGGRYGVFVQESDMAEPMWELV